MLYNSVEFIFLFLPVAFFVHVVLRQRGYGYAAKVLLVLFSLFFYSYWNVLYLPILLLSIGFNFYLSQWIQTSSQRRKTFLMIGVVANIALLGYFKYTDFLISNINTWFNAGIPSLHIVLPLAISFFTFQQIAYLVDSYRGKVKEPNLLNYALFVSFFPQLIAGPIVHHKEMMTQFTFGRIDSRHYRNIAAGLFIFSIGLFKKGVLADNLEVFASYGFENVEELNFINAWLTSLSYTFQIYFDFSGYTDMAVGCALLFNIKLPINFNSPYKASNIRDFWRRWHITLSRFLRDYVYIPLGGNRSANGGIYVNLLMTFLIGGLWHGAGWTFVVWGALHGVAMVVHRVWSKSGLQLNSVLGWFLTFNFVSLSWVFFRASDMSQAFRLLSAMFDPSNMATGLDVVSLQEEMNSALFMQLNVKWYAESFVIYANALLLVAVGFLLVLLAKNSNELIHKQVFKPHFGMALYTTGLFFISVIVGVFGTRFFENTFVYFNF